MHKENAPRSMLLISLCMGLSGQVNAVDLKIAGAQEPVLFYLHGRIVEDQGAEAESEQYGRYEYEAIVKELGRDGHRVVSEARKPNTDPWGYARKIAADIEELKKSGMPSEDITVVGASKGAAIAVLISHLLRDADINYVILAICGASMIEYWEKRNVCVSGNVFSVFEASDELAGSCSVLADRCSDGMSSYEEIELGLGVGHGMLYRPYEQWLAPTLEWTNSGKDAQ